VKLLRGAVIALFGRGLIGALLERANAAPWSAAEPWNRCKCQCKAVCEARAKRAAIDGSTVPPDASPVRARSALLGLLLSTAACDLQCNVDVENPPKLEIDVSAKGDAKAQPETKAKTEGEAKAETKTEAVREVEVEVEPTVCDAIDLELERIVLVPANPPFHDRPLERVSIRISNGADVAVELDSGTDASFLDDRRTLVKADLHQSDWFMPLTLPAKTAKVVEIMVPEGAGKALRTVEVEASPEDQPFSDCKVVDDLLAKTPAAATPI
jgi:hypothetical protein